MDDSEVGKLVADVTVSYSVRELLARIEERQVRTDEKIGQLAGRQEVEALAEKVERHEARWNRMIGAAFAVAALTGSGAGWAASLLAGG